MAGEKFYNVEKILRSKKVGKTMQYFVKWEGYDNKSNTWEPRANLEHLELFKEFEMTQAAIAKKDKSTPAKIKSSIKKPIPVKVTPAKSIKKPTPAKATSAKATSVKPTPAKSTSVKPAPVKLTRSYTRLSDKPTPAKPTRSSTRLSNKAAIEKANPSDRPKQTSLSKKVKPTLSSSRASDKVQVKKSSRSSDRLNAKSEEPTTVSRPKGNSVNKGPGKKGAPATRFTRSSAPKHQEVEQEEVEPEAMETEHPIEQEEQDQAEAPTYRAEVEKVTAVLGCRKDRDENVWVICSFGNDEETTELTPYSVVYHHHPQALLDHWYERIAFVGIENNA
jgi:hypothetical protein